MLQTRFMNGAASWLVFVFASLRMTAPAATFHVAGGNPDAADTHPGTEARPWKTLSKAATTLQPGDTVIVEAGVYRESVSPQRSGSAASPITYQAAAGGNVVISGADVISGWQREAGAAPIFRAPWPHRFIINHRNGKPIEHHPEDAPLWGRAEQVIADGSQLLPVASRDALEQAWLAHREAIGPTSTLPTPLPNLGPAFAGAFFADTDNKLLYVWLVDGKDPGERTLEAATRGLCFGTNPWMCPKGFAHVHVRGFTFRYAASFPQRAAVWLHGAHNVLEDCVIEQMAGGGANVSGTMRRCIVRECGHTGGGASGDDFLNEDNLWERNSWKPIPRIWDAGGFKLTWAKGGFFRRCTFQHNGGPGLWLDIHVRNVALTDCVFDGNEGSGLFIEISRDITVTHTLARSNAVGVVGRLGGDGWSSAGIQIAESMNCVVAHNTCIGNRDGITLREQGPRPLKTKDFGEIAYRNHGHVIVSNLCVFNRGYQLGFWFDNAWFGPHPSEQSRFADESAWNAHVANMPDQVYDPQAQSLRIDHNQYWPASGSLILYGVPWRPKHRKYDNLAVFVEATGFDRHSRVVKPSVADLSRRAVPTREAKGADDPRSR